MFAARAAGFTLIELMVVIAILGTLAAVLLPNILGASDAGNRSATEANMLRLRQGCETFERKHGYYPPDDLRSPEKGVKTDWKPDNGQNTGIESLVTFLSMSRADGADLSDLGAQLTNTDKDDHGVEHKLLLRKDRVEIADAWGMPMAYFAHAGMSKPQLVCSPFDSVQTVTAMKDARGNYHGKKLQFLSAGKDGVFGTEDDMVFPQN